MPTPALFIAAHFLTGSILSLVLPVAVLIVVAIWLSLRWWHRGESEP